MWCWWYDGWLGEDSPTDRLHCVSLVHWGGLLCRSLVDKRSSDREDEVVIKMMSAADVGGMEDELGSRRGGDSLVVRSDSLRDKEL